MENQLIAEYSPDAITEVYFQIINYIIYFLIVQCNVCKKLIEQSELRICHANEDKLQFWKHQLCWSVPENVRTIKDIHTELLNHEDLKKLELYIDKKYQVPDKHKKRSERRSNDIIPSILDNKEEPSVEHKSKKNKASKIKRATSPEILITNRKSQRLNKIALEGN